MVVAAEVEHAVYDRLCQVGGVLGADHHVAELARAGGRSRAVDREREHVGRLVTLPVVAVELSDLVLPDESNRQVTVLYTGGGESRLDRPPQGRLVGAAVDLDVGGQLPVCLRVGAGRRPGARFSAYSL